MKWLIYLLLLINLAFALWHFRGQDTRVAVSPEEDETLNLVLLKEYLAQQARVEPQVSPPEQNAAERCYTLGPFKTKKAAGEVSQQMATVGIQAKRRLSKDNSRKGFWVLIPPEKSREGAKEHIKELKQKGIKDYFLVVTGEQTNAVSLGVFIQSDSAQRRYQQMQDLGFDVKMEQVDLPLREYWLDWPQQQILLPELLGKFRQQHAGIGQTERGCKF